MLTKFAHKSFRSGLCIATGFLFSMLSATTAPAQTATARNDGDSIRIELNRLAAVGVACSACMKIENRFEALKSFRLDLFAMDKGGVVAQRLAVQLGPIVRNKTHIKLFDFSKVTCEKLGSVLLNDVPACESRSGPVEGCLGFVTVSTRSVPLLM